MFTILQEVRKYIQTRSTYLLIVFKCEGRTFKHRAEKTKLIKKAIEEVKKEFNVDFIEIVDNVYRTVKRHAISKILKICARLNELTGVNEYYFIRNITVRTLKTLAIDENYAKMLQTLLMRKDISEDVKKLVKKTLRKIKKKKESIAQSSKVLKIGEHGEIRKSKTFRLILIIKKASYENSINKNVAKVKKAQVVQKLLKELKKNGFEMNKVINCIYVSKTKHNLVKLLEAISIVKKYDINCEVFAGLRVSKKLIEVFGYASPAPVTETEKPIIDNNIVELAKKILKMIEEKPSIRKAMSYRVEGTGISLTKAIEEILKKVIEYKEGEENK